MRRRHVTVIGAGAAGLAVVESLAALEHPPAILLLEARDEVASDRTWSSWFSRAEAERLELDVTWPRWSVHDASRDVIRSAPDVVYGCIGSRRRADVVLGRLEGIPEFTVRFGSPVRHVRATSKGLQVIGDHGVVDTDLVLDARPRELPPQRPTDVSLEQRFRGWEIRSERPVFDPSVARLMDFRVSKAGAVHFVYVLPFDRHRALVEDTWFVPPDAAAIDHEAQLRPYLAEHLDLVDFEILRTEAGVLPMTTRVAPAPTTPGHLAIGVAGGWMRPSTGYSFRTAVRRGDALALAFADGRAEEWKHRWPRIVSSLDRVFLRFLRDRPDLAADAFVRLFARADARQLVRFLEGQPDAAAIRAVVAALPARPLVAASWRCTTSAIGVRA